MTLLIIGGTGFFGKSIMNSFISNKLDKFKISHLYILSRSVNNFKKTHPEFINPRIEYINGDISIVDFLPNADIIIHAATSTNQMDYLENSIREKQNTELGVSNYIKLASKFHKNSKIIYCSSGAVYGKQPSNLNNISEDFPFQDLDKMPVLKRDYGLSKRNAEKLIINSGIQGLNVSIARCFAFYGKYLPEDGHFAYANFLKSAKSANDIIVNANHEVIRSYMHADDLVESLIKIALNSNPSCPIYNVGSDIPISIFDLAEKIAIEFNVKVIANESIDLNRIDRYVPNTDKLKSILIN